MFPLYAYSIHGIDSSPLDYSKSLFAGLPKKLTASSLQKNMATKVLTRTRKLEHVSPFQPPCTGQLCPSKLILKFHRLFAPSYTADLLCPNTPVSSLRSVDQLLLTIPRAKLETEGTSTFAVRAHNIHNSLPFKFFVTYFQTIYNVLNVLL